MALVPQSDSIYISVTHIIEEYSQTVNLAFQKH